MKPVLTEDGLSIKMDDAGLPVFINDEGAEVGWDVPKQILRIKEAETDAADRRHWLEDVSKAVGFDGDTRKAEQAKKLTQLLEAYSTDGQELTSLRAAKAAGELDDSASDKIKALAMTLNADEMETLKSAATLAQRDKATSDADKAQAFADLDKGRVRQALSEHWGRCKADKTGKMPAFEGDSPEPYISAMMMLINGNRLKSTGAFDEHGSPVVRFVDTETGEHVVKGLDGLEPLSLNRYALDTLPKAWSILFKQSSEQKGDLTFGKPGVKSFGDMSPTEIEAAARASV